MNSLFGLRNLGNTCYINSVIHCLRHNPELVEYLCSERFIREVDNKNKNDKNKRKIYLIESFATIIKKTKNIPDKTIIRPQSFIHKFDIEFKQVALNPNDAHEALNFLLDRFHELISRPIKIKKTRNITEQAKNTWEQFFGKNYSDIINIFYGQYENKIQCQSCKYVSTSFTPFNDIQVELTKSLSKSIDIAFSGEEVEKRCEKCSTEKNVKMIKKTNISMFPNHLIVQIKRFQYTQRGLSKKNEPIDIPELIDISKYYSYQNRYGIYHLYGGIVHSGSPTFGHYVAFCKNGDSWYKYDDETVTRLNLVQLKYMKENAYILFYKKY
jgi:ubiquitin C-terminal hydrolase